MPALLLLPKKALYLRVLARTMALNARLDALERQWKANFDPNQLRRPKGEGGGQWAKPGEDVPLASREPRPPRERPLIVIPAPRPSSDPEPPVEPPPEVPTQTPLTTQERNRVLVQAARWFGRALLLGHPGVRLFVAALNAVRWTYVGFYHIEAFLQEPRSLEQLQADAHSPRPGYDIHHIVERQSARQHGFERWMIQSPTNLVRIPTYRHWEINAWYQTPQEIFGMMTPRDYLRDRQWEDHIKVGIHALRIHGVLR